MNAMMQKGNWQVISNCCAVKMCNKCRENGKPVRIVVTEGCSEEYAKYIASKFPEYAAEAVQG